MAGLVDAGKGLMLSGFTASAAYVSLHTADPGSNGASEVTGGSYSRESASWGSPSAGAVANSGSIVFDVPSATTITHLGYWSAALGGTFYGSRQLDTSQTFSTAGTYTISGGNLSESIS